MASTAATSTGSAASPAPKTAIITGASSGLGLAFARRFVGAGYHVLAVGRDEIRLREALKDVDQTRVSYLAADLSTVEGPTKVIEEGVKLLPGERLDVLINNAGCGVMSQHLGGPSTTLEAYEAMMNLNVRSVYLLTHTAIAHLEKTQGCIINLSSIAGSRPLAGFAAYCMSKAAVELLTKTAALEFAPKRVRVNAIAPATIETDFHARAGMGKEMAAAYYDASAATHPIGRVGCPDDIAEMALFLADPSKSGFVTGTVMVADGGRLLTTATAPQLSKA